MKTALLICAAVATLQGCGFELGPQPVPGPDAETVKLVLYYSDGDFEASMHYLTFHWSCPIVHSTLPERLNDYRPKANADSSNDHWTV